MDAAAQLNALLEAEAPTAHACLSPLGRAVHYPRDIPFQAAEARASRFNATIGQITDGHGHALTVPAIARALGGLPDEARNAGLLYSPIGGLPDVRSAWRAWQRRAVDEAVPSTLPLVTAGISHGIALVADLFAGPQRPVAVAAPFWGNYRAIFEMKTGACLMPAPAFVAGEFQPGALVDALRAVAPDTPALVVLNHPSNPGGYSPTVAERAALVARLAAEADRRPLVVVCDDAYQGLVFDPEVPAASLFWELVGRHPRLLPVKVDGATKEFTFFGGRVGFVTFGLAPDTGAAAALEDKLLALLRASIGSPVAASQVALLEALRDPAAAAEVEHIRLILHDRYRALKEALRATPPDLLTALPFNAGCFALLEIPAERGITSEELRRHLLAEEDTGVVAVGPRFVRLAFCSVDEAALPELVRRVGRGVAALARG